MTQMARTGQRGMAAARCAEGRHQWLRDQDAHGARPHVEHCGGCGVRGIWMPAESVWRTSD